MTASEREFSAAEVEAWREGDWVIATLAGEVVLRRLTRDRAFDSVEVVFAENRSPLYPKTREHFQRAVLAGPWTRGRYRGPGGSNRLVAPITPRRAA